MRNIIFVMAVALLLFPSLALGYEGEIRDINSPTCSPKDGTIVFSTDLFSGDGNYDLWRINPDGTGLTRLTTTPDTGEEEPIYSPDGKYIACSSGSVYIMNADGTNPLRANREKRTAYSAAWVKDSSHLAIDAGGDIMLIDRYGNEDRMLFASETMYARNQNISSDGVWMVYEAESLYCKVCADNSTSCSQIWKRNIALKGKPIQLTTGHYSDERPRFSPDNKSIVFQSDRDKKSGISIYSMNSDGTNLRRIKRFGYAEYPTWTAEGKRIVFVLSKTDANAENSTADLASIRPDGTDFKMITRTVAAPKMTPEGGLSDGPLTVRMSCPTPGAIIRYTTDGEWPTESSPTYSGPIYVNRHGTTIMAKAWKPGYLPSLVNDSLYEFMPMPPKISVRSGQYSSPQTVTLSCETSDTIIRYTTDGTEPTKSSTLYTGPIEIDRSLTLTANAWRPGWLESAINSAAIELKAPTPTFSPEPGTYEGVQYVTISCAVSGATIRYTLDGTEPSGASAVYKGPVTVSQTSTLKAKAWMTDWTLSDMQSGRYILKRLPKGRS